MAKNSQRSIWKILAIVLGSLVALFVAAAIVIPLVVNVDEYRPQIEEAINERINGDIELGELSLSLWGQIRVDVEGLKLTGPKGTQIVSVKDAYFHVPFSSIFGGAPSLTFKMQNPEVNVVKLKDGTYNVMALMKDTAPAAEPAPAEGQNVTIPALAARARLGVELRDALVTYKDLETGIDTRVKDLNVVLRDISLSRPTELEAWADLNTQMGESLKVQGPIRLTGQANPELSGGKFQKLTAEAKLNLDQLQIVMPGTFEKRAGIPAHAEFRLTTSPEKATIEKLYAKFHNAELNGSGSVTNLQATPAAPVMNIQLQSNEVPLGPWTELLPMLKEYNLGGVATFQAEAKGPAEKLKYEGALAAKNVTATAPSLKAKPEISALVKFSTDKIDSMNLTMKAPGNELRAQGEVVSFTNPRVTMQVTSPGMDLDQLINFPPPGEAEQAAAQGAPAANASPGAKGAAAPVAAQDDYDALVAPLRENEILAKTHAVMDVNIKSLKAYNARMTDLVGRMTFKDLVMVLERFGMTAFEGPMTATGSVDFKPAKPTYRFSTEVKDLNIQKAVASQMDLFKNTVTGQADFKMQGSGSSFNPEAAKANLDAKGSMRVDQATFASIDVGKMAAEAVEGAINKLAAKLPALKNKNVKAPGGRESKYDFISSDFTIQGGKFSAPNFAAKALPNQGIDLRGNTVVGLIDQELDANWEVIDTYNLLKLRELSIEQAGVKVENILAEGNGPVKFPVSVGCTLEKPCYSYGQVPEYLSKVALSKATQGVQSKAKAEVQKKVEEKLKDVAPPKVKDAIKGFGKKLFGR